jgi:hypothetical protein
VVATVEILHEDKATLLASLKASCIYEIANFNDFLTKGTNQVTFPESVVVTFNSITISTVRGLMFSQFKGTHLHTAILPIIDPTAFVKNKMK